MACATMVCFHKQDSSHTHPAPIKIPPNTNAFQSDAYRSLIDRISLYPKKLKKACTPPE